MRPQSLRGFELTFLCVIELAYQTLIFAFRIGRLSNPLFLKSLSRIASFPIVPDIRMYPREGCCGVEIGIEITREHHICSDFGGQCFN
jgi:hypothetical protein